MARLAAFLISPAGRRWRGGNHPAETFRARPGRRPSEKRAHNLPGRGSRQTGRKMRRLNDFTTPVEERCSFMDSGMIMSKDSHSLKVKCCIVSIALAAVPAWGADVQSGIDDFNPDISPYSYVDAIALQADGKVVVGGYFTAVGGQPRTNLARLQYTQLSN